MAKKVGTRDRGRKDEKKNAYVMVIKGGKARIELREGDKVISSRRVTRRNRYKG